MRTRLVFAALIALISLGPAAARADDPITLKLKITKTAGGPALTRDDGRSDTLEASGTFKMSTTMESGAACETPKLVFQSMLGGAPTRHGLKSEGGALVSSVRLSKGTYQVGISCGGADHLGALFLRVKPATVGPSPDPGSVNTEGEGWAEISSWLALPCNDEVSAARSMARDNHDRDTVQFIITPLGSVLRAPSGSIDEDDLVLVTIVGAKGLLPLLHVYRGSKVRDESLDFWGSRAKLNQLLRQSLDLEGSDLESCASQTFTLTDFAPGAGKVVVGARIGKVELPLGSFEFKVNHVYHGTLSFGPVMTRRVHTGYVLTPNGGNQVIARDAASDAWDLQYAFFLTAFMHHPPVNLERNAKKGILEHGPTVGVGVDGWRPEAFVGWSLYSRSVLLTVGAHFERGHVLDPRSGLNEGDAFAGAAGDIPTVRKLDCEAFASLHLDLHAATALLGAAFSGAKDALGGDSGGATSPPPSEKPKPGDDGNDENN